jgi:uncharacterized protein (DUF58 family)
MPTKQLVKVDDHDAIAQLQFFARNVVEGISGGRHRSSHKGASVVFKEHRQYARGDEIRSIDWKLFGKTDRLFIRQFEDETNLRAMILLDQSGSMKYQGTRATDVSKHGFAKRLSACLATLLVSQQDAVGLCLLDTTVRQSLPPRSNPGYLQAIFQTLVASQPGGETSLAEALKQAAGAIRRRGLIILVSDCFDDVDQLVRALSLFRRNGHEVLVFQVWDPDELDFPFHGRTQFRSLENDRRHLVDPRTLRSAYLERVRAFRQHLELEFARERIELISCRTSQNCGEVLIDFIGTRRRSSKRSAVAGSQTRIKVER